MKKAVGLWIDHTKAIIVTIKEENEETRRVLSNIGKYVYFSGGSIASPLYGTCNISGRGKQDHEFRSLLTAYFENVITLIRHADSIWIIGPGEAKGELEILLQHDQREVQIEGIANMGKMTDRQITAVVRQHYQGDV